MAEEKKAVKPEVKPYEKEGLTPLERVEAEMRDIKDQLDKLDAEKKAEAKGEPKPAVVEVAPPTYVELSDRLTDLAVQRDALVAEAEARKQRIAKAKADKAEEEKI